MTVRDRVERVRVLAPTLLLVALAAGASWFIAQHVVGDRAYFAPVAAVITLGLTAGARLERAIEMSLGVPLGIALADLLVVAVGSGPVQLTAIVLLAIALAVFLGGGPLLVTQAAVSSILVVTLQPPTHGVSFTRAADALIGCGTALVLHFLIAPIDPLRLARRSAGPVLHELAGVLDDIAGALERRDRAGAVASLRRAREPLAIYSEAGGQLDLAVRNVRVLARGAMRAIDVGDHVPPEVPGALRELREAVLNLDPWLQDPARASAVVDPAVRAARHASAVLEQTANLSVSVIVGQIRSTAVDLLRSTGMSPEDARGLVRAKPRPGGSFRGGARKDLGA